MHISDSKRQEIRDLANEILEARTDAEFNEACRAMQAVIAQADVDATKAA